jgi:hypothetical protein
MFVCPEPALSGRMRSTTFDANLKPGCCGAVPLHQFREFRVFSSSLQQKQIPANKKKRMVLTLH